MAQEMEQDKQRHFLSLTRVLLSATLGGAAGFFLFVYDSDDAESTKFLLSQGGFTWLVVMMAQFAIWGVFAVLIWTKMLWLFRDAVMHHQRLQAFVSLALYLAAYLLLLWFPQPLFEQFFRHELPKPFEQMVPLAHYQGKQTIFSVVQSVVKLFAVAGLWLADWRIRNRIASNGSEEECVSALLEARSFLLNLGAILATLSAFSFLTLVSWGEALRLYVSFTWFSRPPLIIYGLYLTVLVAIPYIPAYLNLLAAGRGVRDRFYPRLLPCAPDYKDRDIHRRRVDELLKLQLPVKDGLKILITILAPVATSVVYAFLGLKQ
jgi:hypothetical protein